MVQDIITALLKDGSKMTTIKFEISDDDFKKIETHKWNTQDWDRVEKTISYLRRKYGQPKSSNTLQHPEDNSWVKE